jgi:hypothetical protein
MPLARDVPIVGEVMTLADPNAGTGEKLLAAAGMVAIPEGVVAKVLSTASKVVGRGGVTAVGRALQKHAARAGSWFSGRAAAGRAAANTKEGTAILTEILEKGESRAYTHQVFGDIVDVTIKDGPGARLTADGKFIGFLEP